MNCRLLVKRSARSDGGGGGGRGSPSLAEITLILDSIAGGDESSRDRLLLMVYGELRRLAAGQMRRERANHTLQPTELVHEACIRLLGSRAKWENRRHFYSSAAEAMRRILVDHARKKSRIRRGGDRRQVELPDDHESQTGPKTWDLLILDDALKRLELQDARVAEVVKLRFFAGLSVRDVAKTLEVSEMTVKRDWAWARAWLYDTIYGEDEENEEA